MRKNKSVTCVKALSGICENKFCSHYEEHLEEDHCSREERFCSEAEVTVFCKEE
jgi:hypothetical protein